MGRRRFSGAGPELERGEWNTKHGGENTKQGVEGGSQEEKTESDRARGETRDSESEARSAHFTRGLTGSMSYPDVGPDYVSLASYCSSSCVQVFTARHARVLQDITLL